MARLPSTFVGFDLLCDMMMSAMDKPDQSFPPHNIIALDDDSRLIEISCAGFTRDELEVAADHETLTVVSRKHHDSNNQPNVVYGGLAKRNFRIKFFINKLVIDSVQYRDGLLSIMLKRSESDKRRIYEIEQK